MSFGGLLNTQPFVFRHILFRDKKKKISRTRSPLIIQALSLSPKHQPPFILPLANSFPLYAVASFFLNIIPLCIHSSYTKHTLSFLCLFHSSSLHIFTISLFPSSFLPHPQTPSFTYLLYRHPSLFFFPFSHFITASLPPCHRLHTPTVINKAEAPRSEHPLPFLAPIILVKTQHL